MLAFREALDSINKLPYKVILHGAHADEYSSLGVIREEFLLSMLTESNCRMLAVADLPTIVHQHTSQHTQEKERALKA
jgi:hypothetical protein